MELGGLHPHPQAHALPPEQEASPTRPSRPAAVIAAVIRGKRSFFMVTPNEPLSKRYKNNPHSTGVGSTPRESHSLRVCRAIYFPSPKCTTLPQVTLIHRHVESLGNGWGQNAQPPL